MKRFMVVCWYYDGEHNFIGSNVVFYDSLAAARKLIYACITTGDYAQLYMLHGDGPDGYYVYCNE